MTTTPGEDVPAHTGADAHAQEEQVSPQAAALRAMFPDFDVAVLYVHTTCCACGRLSNTMRGALAANQYSIQ